MINAAEPVDEKAITNFYETFKSYGLSSGVIVPTYGLAEHTVFVCSGGMNVLRLKKSSFDDQIIEVLSSSILGEVDVENDSISGHTNVQVIVGCGYPARGAGVRLVIVENETNKVLGEDKIGEIWITSPSKAQGYWNQPELTSQDFHAQIAQPENENEYFLRSGDLGFLHKGELFICGRSKDLIIVRGSNHYPQDIERTAERSQPLLRAGCSAAFSVPHTGGHTEMVVYVAEVVEKVQSDSILLAGLVASVRQAVSSEHGLTLSAVLLLKTRSVPKTTSGKIARTWCRRGFIEGTLSVVHRWDGVI
eukprot:CAMPEP_0119049522 /NCGR_PEP_ID=MMETSP1177-20130426/65205_1 /TAXON_ID=2985 /ORGANISM="Ochromonas sp, Strain CCMP1899" /LENGTH=305 /DNA_ID=CAMNT_0007026897 /DNA_START=996 /DNA_END=1910 /DNA_ORIENTATION=+